jgi:hypothetical protein
MLVCGTIDELTRSSQYTANGSSIAYFFCQASDERINNAEAVLRGITYRLLQQHKTLIEEISDAYKGLASQTTRDVNTWDLLCGFLRFLLGKFQISDTCILIDGLDERESGLDELLKLFDEIVTSGVKVLVSSRNWPSIEQGLGSDQNHLSVRLELNPEAIQAAVGTYIDRKVAQLAGMRLEGLDPDFCPQIHALPGPRHILMGRFGLPGAW